MIKDLVKEPVEEVYITQGFIHGLYLTRIADEQLGPYSFDLVAVASSIDELNELSEAHGLDVCVYEGKIPYSDYVISELKLCFSITGRQHLFGN